MTYALVLYFFNKYLILMSFEYYTCYFNIRYPLNAQSQYINVYFVPYAFCTIKMHYLTLLFSCNKTILVGFSTLQKIRRVHFQKAENYIARLQASNSNAFKKYRIELHKILFYF